MSQEQALAVVQKAETRARAVQRTRGGHTATDGFEGGRAGRCASSPPLAGTTVPLAQSRCVALLRSSGESAELGNLELG